jgi:ketosteroid isomerase-like protein
VSTVDDVDELIEQYNLALGEFYKGNPEPVQKLWSHRNDVTLAPPFGAPTHGWEEVCASMERGASQFSDGENVGFEIIERHVSPDLAYVVRVERGKAKVGAGEDVVPIALRVTMIFRPEGATWKVVHRHADPITTRRPAESVIQE